MKLFPERTSLVNQVAEILEREIAGGAWQEWLPNERMLCESMQVSRNTLRAALGHLKARKIIKAVHPLGTRIIVRPPVLRPAERTRLIGLLSPDPIDLLRPNVALIIDELRAQLAEIGYRLHIYHGGRYLNPNSHAALKKLVEANAHDCWVLVLANEQVKRWFFHAGVKCVVSGSCGPDVPVPFVDLDYRALCRHAVGRMLAMRHRRVAFLNEKSDRAGLLECELGFLEGVSQASHPDVEGKVIHHQATMASVISALEMLLDSNRPPTALLVSNPNHYLLALTYLNQNGRRVPRDISLVCTDDDPFLSFVYPTPTRYVFNAHIFAKRLFRLIRQVSDGQIIAKIGVRIMPDHVKGATLAMSRQS